MCQAHDSSQKQTCLSLSGESHITRDFVPDCSQDTDQALSPSGGYGWCLNTIHTSANRPADSGHTTVALETHMCQEHDWTTNSVTMVCPLSKKTTSNALIVWLYVPHLLSTQLWKAPSSLKAAVPRKGLAPSCLMIRIKSGGGLIVLDRQVLEIQDSVLLLLEMMPHCFPYQSGGQSLQGA